MIFAVARYSQRTLSIIDDKVTDPNHKGIFHAGAMMLDTNHFSDLFRQFFLAQNGLN